jgi:hypothetical protein
MGPPGADGDDGSTELIMLQPVVTTTTNNLTTSTIIEMSGIDGDDGWPGPPGPQGATGPSGGGGGGTVTEVEVDFGTTPVFDATFTITDAAITSSASKVVISESGKPATGRVAGDAQWDSILCSANPSAGSAAVYARANPGPVVGKRKLQYSVA